MNAKKKPSWLTNDSAAVEKTERAENPQMIALLEKQKQAREYEELKKEGKPPKITDFNSENSTYILIDAPNLGDVAISPKRNPPKNPKVVSDLFCKLDNDLMSIIDRQSSSKAACVNALIRFAIDELKKQGKTLKVV